MKKALATLLVLALTGTGYANLLSNGDFESPGNTGSITDTAVDNWTAWGGSGWIANDTGDIAIKFWNADSGIYQDVLGVSAGTDYDFSVDVWSYGANEPLTAGSADLKVEWFDASDAQISAAVEAQFLPSSGYDTWVNLSATVEAPANASYARFTLSEGADSAGSVYFDNADMVVSVPEPVSAALLGIGIAFIYALRKKVRN